MSTKSSGLTNGQLNPKRYNLKCYLCGIQNPKTPALTCDFRNCTNHFHIKCGIENNVIRNPVNVLSELHDPSNKSKYAILC